MIVVTGGAGFIGSAIVWKLNQLGEKEIIIVDELGQDDKWKNLTGLNFIDFYHKDDFISMVMDGNLPFEVETLIHMGACSSTTEKDADYLFDNNFRYSQELAKFSLTHRAKFIYASSAATYGDGSDGYSDNEKLLFNLRPLNMYGYSKQLFDAWLYKTGVIDEVVGLKFFNVYGPNEYHKGDMRSVIHKSFGQIKETGKVKLFKSYNPQYADGEQLRDFIYVKDVVDIISFFIEQKDKFGIYNVGTGDARSWNDLVKSVFNSMGKPANIEYIEMPDYLKSKYQYFTQAEMKKLREAGYTKEFYSLESGVEDYVKNYLIPGKYLDSKI
ncbi:MAG: ADP-glyceromanno-heptose 6-epimerase [Ignavibacteriales bacterium CG_4_9_14_3_um_filter_34_10]|nr:MAG: ADP-glyceromanno-heptose 6-epimerase [Ignavibacteriales bacterium CG_4_9_14_3_um_filter_34_10]